MKKLILISVVLAFLCFGKTVVAAEAPNTLSYRLRLEPGQSFRSEVDLTQSVVQDVLGMRLLNKQHIAMVILEEVISVDDEDNVLVKVLYESICFQTEGLMGEMRFDSETDQSMDPTSIGKALQAMIGESFFVKYSPDGRVMEVLETDRLFQRMLDAMELSDPKQYETMRSTLANIYSEEAMKEMLSQIKSVYPPMPIEVGQEWTVKQHLEQEFVLETEITFCLAERSDGYATITFDGNMSTLPGGSSTDMGEMKLIYDITGEQNGWYRIDEKTGWVKGAEVHLDLNGEITLIMGADDDMTMTWPIVFQSDMTIRSTEVIEAL